MFNFSCKTFVLITVFLLIVENGNAKIPDGNYAPECKDNNGVAIPKCLPVARLREGKHHYGDSGQGKDPNNLPAWFNPELAKKGQEFARHKLHGIVYAQVLSLVLLLVQLPAGRILHYTQASNTVDKAAKRYLATLLQTLNWYDADITDPNSALFKSLYKVRSIHSSIGSRIQEDRPEFTTKQMVHPSNSSLLHPLPEDPTPTSTQSEKDLKDWDEQWDAFKEDLELAKSNKTVTNRIPIQPRYFEVSSKENSTKEVFYFSQYEMAITQFSFLAFVILMPEKIYIPQSTDEELYAFAHLWTILGYIVGIEDEFNICLNKDLEACKRYCREMLDKEMLPAFFNLDEEGHIMIKSFVLGMTVLQPTASVSTILIAMLEDITGIECPNLLKLQPIGTWLSRMAKLQIQRSSVDAEYYRKFANSLDRDDFAKDSIKYFGIDMGSLMEIADKAFYY